MSKNPFTLEGFLDWVKRQPAEKEYVYFDPCNCPGAQYAQFLGLDRSIGRLENFDDLDMKINRLAHSLPRAFGALALRMEGRRI